MAQSDPQTIKTGHLAASSRQLMLPHNSAVQRPGYKRIYPAISVQYRCMFIERRFSMRAVFTALFLVVTAAPALAQRAPVIVIPGRPDVPVMINGIDASWGVVEGEFGLDRPGAMAPIVIYRPLAVSVPITTPGYFPRAGKKPGYGRLEIVPPANRPLPPPAQSYFRSWSTESPSEPATVYAPFDVPPVVVTPNFGHRNHEQNHGHGKS